MTRTSAQKTARNTNARNRRAAIKRQLREHLSDNPCVVCGDDNIHTLEFDHIDRNTKTESISRLVAIPAPYHTIEHEISKCQSLCVNCHRKKTAAEQDRYRILVTDNANSLDRRYKAKNVKKLMAYLSDKSCLRCGERDPIVLEFDHIDPTTKVDTISNMICSTRSWTKIANEIAKCQILCANCHRIKTLSTTRPTVYIASGMQNKATVQSLTRSLEINDVIVTYKWFKHGRYAALGDRQRAAINEINGIDSAEIVLVLLPGGRGTHFELGYAIATNKKVLLHSLDGQWADNAGERCAFYSLPQIKVLPSLGNIIQVIQSLSKSATY